MSNEKSPFIVEGKLADNERLKRESNNLRGTITTDLKDDLTGGFTADNFQLIRFHGMYQQDDRDIRAERAKQKLEPLHNVMLRARLPGGVITPDQWLAIDKFAADHTMYVTLLHERSKRCNTRTRADHDHWRIWISGQTEVIVTFYEHFYVAIFF